MDFFRSHWGPQRSVQPEFQFKPPVDVATTRRAQPRVVQIPVHFIGSEATRSASALKIQKVFRGFLVRKSVKKIMEIKREVDAVEARVSQREVAHLIKKEGKERLKVNETLMALLFKLDAVSGGGVDSGIRICRKAVIRKAIALQERVDSIANDQIRENDDLVIENGDDGKVEVEEHDGKALIETGCSAENALNCDEPSSNTCDNGEDEEGFDCVEQMVAESCDKDSEMERDEDSRDCLEGDDVSPGTEPELLKVDSSLMEEEVNEEEKKGVKTPDMSECVEDMMGHDTVDNGTEVEEGSDDDDDVWEMRDGKEKEGGEDNYDRKEEKELLERVVEESGKMMKMMGELFERSEAQARMLNTLALRLEQLEKAFVCDKIRRKKKRHCSS